MLFYDCATAPNPRRARMFIAEKGIEIETRQIDLRAGEQLGEEYRKVNPRATVPALVTDEGEVLLENIGIATYLEAKFPEPALLGKTPEQKGRIMMWNAIVEMDGLLAVAEALRNGNPHMKDRALAGPRNFEQIPALAERGMARAAMFWDTLDARLGDVPYLAGDEFSFADITAFVVVDFARVIKQGLGEKHTAAQKWYDAIKARPSAAA